MNPIRGVAVLAPAEYLDRLAKLISASSSMVRVEHVGGLAQLEQLAEAVHSLDEWLLLSYGTSCIVPEATLSRFWLGVNFHAASPEYPGRDPHHFAAYDGVSSYGATAHVMTKAVDAGPIVGVKWFPVKEPTDPMDLLSQSNEACWELIDELVPLLLHGQRPTPLQAAWGRNKRSRKDFLALCEISCAMDADEVARRVRATQFGSHSNAYIDLHDHRFRHEPTPKRGQEQWAEFTVASYASLLDTALKNYRFSLYGEQVDGRHLLWRHDVDFSVHRALRLARLEHEKRARATYFFMLRSSFYNLLEAAVLERAREIVALGHQAGLHLSAASAHPSEIEAQAARERDLLSQILGSEVSVVSFHNPTVVNPAMLARPRVAGMVNAYGNDLMERYSYCSDSNGYWRYRSLKDVLTIDRPERLHVLTHPAWWTEEPMSPRERVERAVFGRSAAVMRGYDALLLVHGRKNIR